MPLDDAALERVRDEIIVAIGAAADDLTSKTALVAEGVITLTERLSYPRARLARGPCCSAPHR